MIEEKIREILSYYRVESDKEVVDSIKDILYCHVKWNLINRKFKVKMFDGSIAEESIPEDILEQILVSMDIANKMQGYDEEVLNSGLVGVRYRGDVYFDIEDTLREYVSNHEPLINIFKVCRGCKGIFLYGNTVNFLNEYIKKGKYINAKAQLLGIEEADDENYSYNKLVEDISKKSIMADKIQSNTDENLWRACHEHNISYRDSIYRIEIEGLSKKEAIELGISDRDKWGVVNEYMKERREFGCRSKVVDGNIITVINMIHKMEELGCIPYEIGGIK